MMRIVHGFLIVFHTLLGASEVAQVITAQKFVANTAATKDADESPSESVGLVNIAEPGVN